MAGYGNLVAMSPLRPHLYLVTAFVVAYCQTPSQRPETPRDMFFGGLHDAVPERSQAGKRSLGKDTPQAPRGQREEVPARGGASFGLRYSLLKIQGIESVEVSRNTEFSSDDRIRLRVRANADSYLYVVSEGTSGNWSVLFPKMKPQPQPNKITAGAAYEFPSDSAFRFTGNPGTERMFILLTRKPEQNLDKLIYAVRTARPGDEQPDPAASQPVVSRTAMERLQSSTRDLLMEDAEVSQSTLKDFGVYVVNRSRAVDSQVVAEILLKHK
jgi:hypothetical protein